MRLALCLLLLGPAAGCLLAAERPPNILVLFTDDQRADTIRLLGNPAVQTPHLDGLVRSGTVLDRVYCMGALQGAVCVPSRAMLMTGRSLFRAQGQMQGQETWPARFGASGYQTFFTGKWHNGRDSLHRSFQSAAAVFHGGMGDPWKLPLEDWDGSKVIPREGSGRHAAEIFTDRALAFLDRRSADRPFLLFVSYTLPHDPRIAPPEYHRLYAPERMRLPPNFLPRHPFDNGELAIRDEQLAAMPRDPGEIRRHLADYYACISWVDTQAGRLLEKLEALQLRERTVVLFASDHGLALGSHGLMGKQNLYEHSMRAPVVLSGPGIPRGKRIPSAAYLLDLFPTLGAMAGVKAPQGNEGISLLPDLQGKPSAGREAVLTAYRDVQRAVTGERWKLIHYPAIGREQLFDLRRDPHEQRDLIADPRHRDRAARLRETLRDLQRAYGDPLAP